MIIVFARKGEILKGFEIKKDGFVIIENEKVLAFGFSTKEKAKRAYKFAF